MNGAVPVDVALVGIVSAVVVATAAVLTLVWKLMGSPTPLSHQNLAKPIRFAKRKYAGRQAAKARQHAELAEEVLRCEREATLRAFEASVLRLLDMERSAKSYHSTEWRRQIATCKHDTLRVLRQAGVRVGSGWVQHGPWIGHFKTCSIVVDWGPSKWNLGRVQLVVFWHPNPSLTVDEFFSSDFPDGTIEHVKVLSKSLTDADMEVAGWECFGPWRADFVPAIERHAGLLTHQEDR